MRKEIEFEGIVSGDGESFCFNVDEENFAKATGRQPEVTDYPHTYDRKLNPVREGDLARLYPNDIFGYDHVKLKIRIIVEPE